MAQASRALAARLAAARVPDRGDPSAVRRRGADAVRPRAAGRDAAGDARGSRRSSSRPGTSPRSPASSPSSTSQARVDRVALRRARDRHGAQPARRERDARVDARARIRGRALEPRSRHVRRRRRRVDDQLAGRGGAPSAASSSSRSPMKTAVSRLAFEPEAFDVVVTPAPYAEPLVGARRTRRTPARRCVGPARRRPVRACSLPAHGAAEDIAGQGVANPASMLLAAALMLGEGLGERRAAETLTGAVLEACSNGTRTPDMVSTGMGATTREFTDVVLSRARRLVDERRVLPRGRCMRAERRRRDPPLARGRGRRRRLRAPGRRDPADLRRVRARDDRAPRARPARAGRGAHGRGVRARDRTRRCRGRHVGAGRDEPRDADRRRLDGLDAARVHHRPGALAPHRHRRVPGVRHHRHHDPGGQALVARPGRRGAPARAEGRVPRRANRALRAGARRHPARRPGGGTRLRVPGRGRAPRLEAAAARPSSADQARRARRSREPSGRCSTWAAAR